MEPMNASPDSLRERELDVAREIANAFLTAGTPVEVYRLAQGQGAAIELDVR